MTTIRRVDFDPEFEVFELELENYTLITFYASSLRLLENATIQEMGDVSINSSGTSLVWGLLKKQISLLNLVKEVLAVTSLSVKKEN